MTSFDGYLIAAIINVVGLLACVYFIQDTIKSKAPVVFVLVFFCLIVIQSFQIYENVGKLVELWP